VHLNGFSNTMSTPCPKEGWDFPFDNPIIFESSLLSAGYLVRGPFSYQHPLSTYVYKGYVERRAQKCQTGLQHKNSH
jgi:hypothetical protein